jgi:hypothetical protein
MRESKVCWDSLSVLDLEILLGVYKYITHATVRDFSEVFLSITSGNPKIWWPVMTSYRSNPEIVTRAFRTDSWASCRDQDSYVRTVNMDEKFSLTPLPPFLSTARTYPSFAPYSARSYTWILSALSDPSNLLLNASKMKHRWLRRLRIPSSTRHLTRPWQSREFPSPFDTQRHSKNLPRGANAKALQCSCLPCSNMDIGKCFSGCDLRWRVSLLARSYAIIRGSEVLSGCYKTKSTCARDAALYCKSEYFIPCADGLT